MSERDEGPLSGSGGEEECRRPGVDEQVCEALAAHSQLDASQIGVAVDSATGDLILFGTVSTEEQRRLAEDCATSIRGVSVVYNRLTLGRNMGASRREGSEDKDPEGPAAADPPVDPNDDF